MNYMVYQGLGLKGRLHTNGQGGCGLYGVLFAGFDHYHWDRSGSFVVTAWFGLEINLGIIAR